MISLVLPDHDRRESWLSAMEEFGEEALHGFSTFGFDVEELREFAGFERWLQRETRLRTAGEQGLVPATVWWVLDDASPTEVLGSIHLRHELNEYLRAEGGHIGYGVRPSARGRGVAMAAFRLCLAEARSMGLRKALVCCEAGNAASQHMILAAGGVPEHAPGAAIERYWIELAPQSR